MTTEAQPNATSYPFVPGLAGVPCAESAISFIDGERGVLEYRGIPIQELAEHSTFEETAHLLLFGTLPAAAELAAFGAELARHRELPSELLTTLQGLPASGRPMSALQAAVAALGMLEPIRPGSDPAVRRYWVVRLVAALPVIVAAIHWRRIGLPPHPPRADLGHAANFLYMLSRKEPDPEVARIMDVAFILHADHTMNASTFTARVVGSTLADPFSVVAAAIGALSGPLHGGANERVLEFLRGIGSVANVAPVLDAMISRKEKIVGLGHRIYHVKDPRAVMLQQLAEQLFARAGREPLYDLALEVERVAADRLGARGIFPNVDFYSGAVYAKMGIPEDLFTPIFAASRVAGWLAHWLELLPANRIYRPEQVYVGGHGRTWVPVADRV